MLSNDKRYKVYKFDYGNSIKFIVSFIYQVFANLGACILIFVGFIVIFGTVRNINNDVLRIGLASIIIILFASLIILAFVFPVLPKKVILTDYSIRVRRYAIPFHSLKRGFNDYIPCSAVVSCKIYEGRIRDGKNLSVILFNWDNLVEVKDTSNRRYYFPIKDADDFVDEVNEIINNGKCNDNLS